MELVELVELELVEVELLEEDELLDDEELLDEDELLEVEELLEVDELLVLDGFPGAVGLEPSVQPAARSDVNSARVATGINSITWRRVILELLCCPSSKCRASIPAFPLLGPGEQRLDSRSRSTAVEFRNEVEEQELEHRDFDRHGEGWE